MAAIEEIPIEAEVQPEKEEKEIENNQQEIEEIQEEFPKKSRGRPPGAKNKAKPKPPPPAPKPKAKTKKVKAPVYEEESSEDEDFQPQPTQPLDRHALASDVLSILQQQRFQRTNARRSHYASWFENMA